MKPSKHLILFVCTGNICRSPMAEYLFRHYIKDKNSNWDAVSGGLSASYGQNASTEAVQALNECGVDLSTHRSRPVNRELTAAAAVIIGMTGAHCEQLARLDPAIAEKTFLLMSFASPPGELMDLADPIGMSLDVYRKTRETIARAVPGLYEFVNELDL